MKMYLELVMKQSENGASQSERQRVSAFTSGWDREATVALSEGHQSPSLPILSNNNIVL